jgi:ParB/RepB/Spo0J family partition protein
MNTTLDTSELVRLAYVGLDLIDPDFRNPAHRSEFVDDDLAASIRRDGVLTPVMLRPAPNDPARYRLLAGHRRVVRARAAGLVEVPALVLSERTDLDALRILLMENVHRQDLTLSEEAGLVQGLLDLGVELSALAGEVHRSQGWVRSRRSVARLPREVQARVDVGEVTLEQVAQIDKYADDPKVYARLADALGTYNLTWRIQEVETARKNVATMDKIRTALAKLGVDVVKAGSREVRTTGSNPTHTEVGAIGPSAHIYVGRPLLAKDLKALAAEHDDVVAIEHAGSGPYFALAVPVGSIVDPEEDPAEAAARVEAEAAAQVARDEHAVYEEAARIARDLRVGFIGSVLRGDRRLTAEHIAELASLVVQDASNNHGWGDGLNDFRCWLELTGSLAADAPLSEVERVYAGLPAGAPLVLYLAEKVEGVRPDADMLPRRFNAESWRDGLDPQDDGGFSWRAPVAWYDLLGRLGYRASDAERAALAVPPDGVDAP